MRIGTLLLLLLTAPGARSASYVGWVDTATCGGITGWAADTSRPNIPIAVALRASGQVTPWTLASGNRPDVGAVIHDNGLHGFSLPVLQDGMPHAYQVTFESTTVQLSGGAPTLTCGSAAQAGLVVVREPLVGTVNGINAVFTLSAVPVAPYPVLVIRDGIILSQCAPPGPACDVGGDYFLSVTPTVATVTFVTNSPRFNTGTGVPQIGNIISVMFWRSAPPDKH